jgi:hypothetical protein
MAFERVVAFVLASLLQAVKASHDREGRGRSSRHIQPVPRVLFCKTKWSARQMEAIMDDATAPKSHHESYYDIVILGAGYAGLMAALRLGASENRSGKIALINDCDPFIERVRLQESIARPVPLRIPSISTLLHRHRCHRRTCRRPRCGGAKRPGRARIR